MANTAPINVFALPLHGNSLMSSRAVRGATWSWLENKEVLHLLHKHILQVKEWTLPELCVLEYCSLWFRFFFFSIWHVIRRAKNTPGVGQQRPPGVWSTEASGTLLTIITEAGPVSVLNGHQINVINRNRNTKLVVTFQLCDWLNQAGAKYWTRISISDGYIGHSHITKLFFVHSLQYCISNFCRSNSQVSFLRILHFF